jgi:hypothetical protein
MMLQFFLIKIVWIITLFVILLLSILRFILISWWEKREEYFYSEYNPAVVLIIPCKGIDLYMEKNLKSVKSQNYDKLSIIAVVDSENDSAVDILKKLKINYIISDQRYKGSGKVRAISTAIQKFPDKEVYVMADSDTVLPTDWLRYLVNPLMDKAIGVTTTYPIYEPIENSNIWSKIKKVWGFLGINMMEFSPSRFAWGGSMAIRNDLLDEKSFNYFSSSVSDDAAITKICKDKKLSIYYSKKATPVIHVDETRDSFIEWATRQMAISISHSKHAFTSGIIVYFSIIVYLIVLIPLSMLEWNYFLLGYIPFIFPMIINARRTKNHKLIIFLISFIMPVIFLYNLISGNRKTHIEWRGNRYHLQK